ncbi:hypothetical protein DW757_10255 [Clostridium sp. AM29-11AC]|nr:hypothetical protein DW757_10255 [Clostridium sp. AM29-11AC]
MPFCCNQCLNSTIFFTGLPQEGLRSMPKTPVQAVNFLIRVPVSREIRRFSGNRKDTIPIYVVG